MNPSPPGADTVLIHALQALLQAPSQASTGQPVRLIETHISWVLLAGEQAYKLKKPVQLPFVDFSTLALRRHFCDEEQRLNQRLAPQLYLGVQAITGTPEAPVLGGEGPAIEYAVCMRRFAPGALLSERLAAGVLGAEELQGLAQRVGRFHQQAAVAQPGQGWGQPQQIEQAALKVLAQLQAALGEAREARLAALRQWMQAQALVLAPVWQTRLEQGWVREGHGDLHLNNCVLTESGATGFDCIEFDPALRWIDVMSDLGFLTMDLHAHGRPDLAAGVLDHYLQQTGDIAGLAVLRFYEVYRALVRALVATLSRPQPGAPDYLACAHALSLGPPGGPRLLITLGLSGSGKSTVAAQLLQATGAVRLRSDVERKRLFGLQALQRSEAMGLSLYTPEATRRTFDRLHEQAATALRAGWPVVVDAAFLRRGERDRFQALARSLGLPFGVLHCHCDPALMRSRIETRQARGDDASEATPEVLQSQLKGPGGPEADELPWVLSVDTTEPLSPADITTLARRWWGQRSH